MTGIWPLARAALHLSTLSRPSPRPPTNPTAYSPHPLAMDPDASPDSNPGDAKPTYACGQCGKSYSRSVSLSPSLSRARLCFAPLTQTRAHEGRAGRPRHDRPCSADARPPPLPPTQARIRPPARAQTSVSPSLSLSNLPPSGPWADCRPTSPPPPPPSLRSTSPPDRPGLEAVPVPRVRKVVCPVVRPPPHLSPVRAELRLAGWPSARARRS